MSGFGEKRILSLSATLAAYIHAVMERIKKLNLYTDLKSFNRPKDLALILHPFAKDLGVSLEAVSYDNKWDEDFHMKGKNYFNITSSLERCDYVVAPVHWHERESNEGILQLAQEAERMEKKMIIFFCYDSTEPLPVKNAVVFRHSLYKSQKQQNEFAMPSFAATHTLQKEVARRGKGIKPVVGFCGYLGGSTKHIKNPLEKGLKGLREKYLISNIRVNRLLQQMGITVSRNQAYILRSQAIRLLEKARSIQTNFLIRDRFCGGSREEYVKNMEDSDYILCMRGAGNFSFRFYETLALGRIPIFINTDCCLPFEEYISWKDYCVWVEEDELDQLENKILEFHERLDERAFKEKQQACYQLWKEWLSPNGFYSNLYRYL